MARRFKVMRRGKVRGFLILKSKPGGGGEEGGNGNGNGNGDIEGILPEIPDGGNGNGNGDWETPTPEVPTEELPPPPPGVYEVPTPAHPVVMLTPEQAQTLPAGGVWPREEGEIKGTFLVLAKIPTHGWRFIVVDPDAIKHPEPAPLRK